MRIVYIICVYIACASALFAQRGLTANANEEWSLRFLESLPEFKDGEEALVKYVYTNAIYTQQAIDDNARGRVYIKFVVDETGQIISPEIQKNLHPDLDSVAIAIVNNMPMWNPGIEKGKAVKCPYTLVVNFDFKGRGTPDNPVPSYYWKEIGRHVFMKACINDFGKDSVEAERYYKYITWHFNGLRLGQLDLNLILAKDL